MNHYNFGKHLKLLSSTDYQQVFDDVKYRVGTREFLVLSQENSLSHPRVGIIVSKKVSKRSPDRNRIKRLVREAYRLNQHNLPNHDIIVLARPSAAASENKHLTNQVNYLWKKLNGKANTTTK